MKFKFHVLERKQAYWGSSVTFVVRDQANIVTEIGPFEGYTYAGIVPGTMIHASVRSDGRFERVLWAIDGSKGRKSDTNPMDI